MFRQGVASNGQIDINTLRSRSMIRTILVSGASGIVGYGILRSLRKTSEVFRLIGTTIYDFSVAPAFCDACVIAPRTSDPGYMDWLTGTIRKHSIDMVIPGIECDVLRWNEERARIVSAGAIPLLNNSELIALCSDKWAFYQRLVIDNEKHAIPTLLNGEYGTFPAPFLLKPRRGYGSKGIVTINSRNEFEAYRQRIGPELMMQPIVGSDQDEYTLSAFFDNESTLIDYMTLRRKLSSSGNTQEAEVVTLDLGTFLDEMAAAFKPIGPTNFQFRIADGAIRLLEINPRISAATSIRASFGYNESVMSVEYFLNKHVPPKSDRSRCTGRRAIRYIEDYIIPDDCTNK
jgi:carbamoyl-phosphate synthase large subunit